MTPHPLTPKGHGMTTLVRGVRTRLLRAAGLHGLRSGLVERDRAVAALAAVRAELADARTEIAAVRADLAESQAARRWLDSVVHPWIGEAIANTVRHAGPDAFFRCELNGTDVLLPRDTIRTMTHCVAPNRAGPLVLRVEDGHCVKMGDRLRPGDTFVDVGAATGATTLPLARRHGGDVRVLAFEPARAANRLLRATLAANHYTNVEVVTAAVSDACGTATFAEYDHDETGATPFLPEASAILSGMIDPARTRTYEVPVTTLDAVFAARPDAARARVVKIDVEGFEVAVLAGAADFLARVRPFVSIDIHKHPFQDGTTEPPVRDALARLGYRFEKAGHVLLCVPD